VMDGDKSMSICELGCKRNNIIFIKLSELIEQNHFQCG
jgi:hypothetical protein